MNLAARSALNTNDLEGIWLTISNEPLSTPHRMLLNHSPPSNASSGNSTNSANGFSSKVKVKYDPATAAGWEDVLFGLEDACGGGGAGCVTIGVIFRNDLNPTSK